MREDRMSVFRLRRISTATSRLRRRAWLAAAGLLLLAGCASRPDFTTEEMFDHRGKRRFEAPTVALSVEERLPGTTTDGENTPSVDGAAGRGELTSPLIPGITFGGVLSGDEDELSLYVTDVHLFGNWANGWTEGFYEASGVVTFTREEAAEGETASWRVRVDDPFELWSLKRGTIRYYDSYLVEEEGAGAVRVRVDRLEAYAEWFGDAEQGAGALFYGDARRNGAYGGALVPEFEAALMAVLLDGSPAAESEPAAPPSAASTPAPLPESLVRLLESGTIARDLREAPSLFLAIYNLDYFESRVLDGAVLHDRED